MRELILEVTGPDGQVYARNEFMPKRTPDESENRLKIQFIHHDEALDEEGVDWGDFVIFGAPVLVDDRLYRSGLCVVLRIPIRDAKSSLVVAPAKDVKDFIDALQSASDEPDDDDDDAPGSDNVPTAGSEAGSESTGS